MTGCFAVTLLSLSVGAMAGVAVMCLMAINSDEPDE